jgi:hypothetical protein
MGSSRHPNEYVQLNRQIDAINKLPFSRDLRNRMIERARAIWHREEPDEDDLQPYVIPDAYLRRDGGNWPGMRP